MPFQQSEYNGIRNVLMHFRILWRHKISCDDMHELYMYVRSLIFHYINYISKGHCSFVMMALVNFECMTLSLGNFTLHTIDTMHSSTTASWHGLYIYTKLEEGYIAVFAIILQCIIKTHDNELRGQDEAATTE